MDRGRERERERVSGGVRERERERVRERESARRKLGTEGAHGTVSRLFFFCNDAVHAIHDGQISYSVICY
jgi:hypothetical protein